MGVAVNLDPLQAVRFAAVREFAAAAVPVFRALQLDVPARSTVPLSLAQPFRAQQEVPAADSYSHALPVQAKRRAELPASQVARLVFVCLE